MNILVVDDEKMQREMLQGFLKKRGYQVLSAAGGRSGLALFMEHPVDLVLLDHRMDDMNGDEVLARMKEINPAVRAIMITAYGAVDTAVRVMQLGADDFLEKPVDLDLASNPYLYSGEFKKAVDLLQRAYEKSNNEDILLKMATIMDEYTGYHISW